MVRCVIGWVVTAVLTIAANADDGNLSIDTYDFEWIVAKSGESKLIVSKDQDKTRIVIRSSFESFGMSATEGAALGPVISKTSEMAKKLKGSTGKTETVKAGQLDAEFMTSKDGTFYVRIVRPNNFGGDSLLLDRDAAIAFSAHLKKSKQMVELVDAKINP
jgi:hypothetical protein